MSDDDLPYDAADDFSHDDDNDGDNGDEATAAPRRNRLRRSEPASAEDLLGRVASLIEAARPVPLSASAMINKEEVLDVLDEARDRLPTELREARGRRKERNEYLAKMEADGKETTEAARARAEQMVQRTEVVKAAEHRARRIIEGAEAEARRLRLECEDYCDLKLAGFEVVLERTLKVVGSGRQKLQATNLSADAGDENGFFEGDRP
ncbi:MAG: hypothetical protein ACR2MB_14460 [Acidimicrobiales bacterium]